ncbi:head-tail connector protein [Paraburkholderia caledonica]|jgi:hypothetical protein|uniref:head-tail connector protein n=1 Tax=Paraburkholderia caledonica TaxID=134536 RepID=UPI0038BC2F78
MIIDRALAIAHARVDADDPLIDTYLAAAIGEAEEFTNRKFYANNDDMAAAVLDGTAGDDPMVVEPPIVAAILLIFGRLYAMREDVVTGQAMELPRGSRSMLQPYRVNMGV